MNPQKPSLFDRGGMTYYPLRERASKVLIEKDSVCADTWDKPISTALEDTTNALAGAIIAARKRGASVICAFGAHAIKNGLGRLLGEMLSQGWFSHLASNGAAVIHDWEFAFMGKSSEDVRANVAQGRFGAWEETGLYINLALAVGAYEGLGYGASVGTMIANNGLFIPRREDLLNNTAAGLDLHELIEYLAIPSGFLAIPHPYGAYSLLAAARNAQGPFTCHPMFGHDIIYTHRANRGAVIGRTAERDFLEYVSSVAGLEGGVYLSVGSAVMSPMIFEKALSMARNAGGGKDGIRNFAIHVVDIQEASWDWARGEPPMDNPAYYLRFMKTFNRMGGSVDYACADNRDFIVSLYRALKKMGLPDE